MKKQYLNEVKQLQKIAGILKESDGSGEVQATIQRYAPTLLKALKMRSRDREDINAHDAVKKILETIASSLGLDSSIPFMEDEMFSGVYSPQEALKYTEEMFRDMKEGENGI